jgi:K+-sensing histidine kinase KdpD
MSSEAFMISFVSGVATGCLIGVSVTLLLLLLPPLSSYHDDGINDISPRRLVLAAVALFVVFGLSHALKLDMAAAVLLVLLIVRVIVQLGGIRIGLAASVIAAVVIAFRYLPPIGSIRIAQPNDRFVLILFLLIAVFGTRFVEKRKRKRFGG